MSLASFAAAPGERGAVMGAFQASASLARVSARSPRGVLYDLALGRARSARERPRLVGVLLARALPAAQRAGTVV